MVEMMHEKNICHLAKSIDYPEYRVPVIDWIFFLFLNKTV